MLNRRIDDGDIVRGRVFAPKSAGRERRVTAVEGETVYFAVQGALSLFPMSAPIREFIDWADGFEEPRNWSRHRG